MSNELFADVLLAVPLNDLFTYRIPPEYSKQLEIGCRVVVQFGNRKYYSALVIRLHSNLPAEKFNIKPIESVLDKHPVIVSSQLPLWEWISSYYSSTLGEVYKAALPSALKLESQSRISRNPHFQAPPDLPEQEEAILNMLNNQGRATIQDIHKITGKLSAFSTIKHLLDTEAIVIEEKIAERYKVRTATFVSLHAENLAESEINEAMEALKKAPKQKALFEFFLAETIYHSPSRTTIAKKELLAQGQYGDSALRALTSKNILRTEEQEIGRLDVGAEGSQPFPVLNEAQTTACQEIKASFSDNQQPVLLHGVTSSGKTEIYIQLIKEELEKGNQVLYLVPEIGLTTQLIMRLKRVFGDRAGIYHSKFNDAERVEVWYNLLTDSQQSYQIILGARSAVFLPFRKLGLIIVDEEHENSYKQFDPSPRYNARDVAIVMAGIHHARILLGTATPSFESYYNTKTGKYRLVELNKRYLDIQLPQITLADVRKARRQKQMKSLLTPQLYGAIEQTLAEKGQVILFQNRRGFAPYLQCKNCGWIPRCKHCDVSLTYHKYNSTMVCHYCGHTEGLPDHCAHCHSVELQTKGYGTEKIEEELNLLFPEARIARMDMDTTRAKQGYDKLIHQLEDRRIDILIGTQMVTKGLDFEHVRLVGILNADQLLNYPDFRSYERAYQLIAQVSGRAGRKGKQGQVIIQTSDPEHPVFQQVIENNYTQLFTQQMKERQFFRYPPFFRLIKVVLKHKNKDQLDQCATQLADRMKKQFPSRILGPEYPLISRIQSLYQKEIWIKLDRSSRLSDCKKVIGQLTTQLKTRPGNSGLSIFQDVDPL